MALTVVDSKGSFSSSMVDYESVGDIHDHEVSTSNCNTDSEIRSRYVCCSDRGTKRYCTERYNSQTIQTKTGTILCTSLEGAKLICSSGCQCLEEIPEYICGSSNCYAKYARNFTLVYEHLNLVTVTCEQRIQSFRYCQREFPFSSPWDKRSNMLNSQFSSEEYLTIKFRQGMLYISILNYTIPIMVISGSNQDFIYHDLSEFKTLRICDKETKGGIIIKWYDGRAWKSTGWLENEVYDRCKETKLEGPGSYWIILSCSDGLTRGFLIIVGICFMLILTTISIGFSILTFKVLSNLISRCSPKTKQSMMSLFSCFNCKKTESEGEIHLTQAEIKGEEMQPLSVRDPESDLFISEAARESLMAFNIHGADYNLETMPNEEAVFKRIKIYSDQKVEISKVKEALRDYQPSEAAVSAIRLNNGKVATRVVAPWSPSKFVWTFSILLLLLGVALGCETSYLLSHDEYSCIQTSTYKNCTLNSFFDLSFRGVNNVVCLDIYDPEGKFVGTISAKLKNLQKSWQNVLSYYTVDYITHTWFPRYESCDAGQDWRCWNVGNMYGGGYISGTTPVPIALGICNCAEDRSAGFWCMYKNIMCFYGIKWVGSYSGPFATVFDPVSSWVSPTYEVKISDASGDQTYEFMLPLLGKYKLSETYSFIRKSEQVGADVILNQKLLKYKNKLYLCDASDRNSPQQLLQGDYQSNKEQIRSRTDDGVISNIFSSFYEMQNVNRAWATAVKPSSLSSLGSCFDITNGALIGGNFWSYSGDGILSVDIVAPSNIEVTIQASKVFKVMNVVDQPSIKTLNVSCEGYSGSSSQVTVHYQCTTDMTTGVVPVSSQNSNWREVGFFECDGLSREFYVQSSRDTFSDTLSILGKHIQVSCETPPLIPLVQYNFTIKEGDRNWDGDSGFGFSIGDWFSGLSLGLKGLAISFFSIIIVIIIIVIVILILKFCCAMNVGSCLRRKSQNDVTIHHKLEESNS